MPAICQLCGKAFGQYITAKHLAREHGGMTRDEYAEQFGRASLKAPDYLAPIERSEDIRRRIGEGLSKAQRAKGDQHHAKRPEVRAKIQQSARARVATPQGKAQLDAAREAIDHARCRRTRRKQYEGTNKAQEDHRRAAEASLMVRAKLRREPSYVHPSSRPEVRAKISASTAKMHREGRLVPVYTMTKPHRVLVEALQAAGIYEGFQPEYQLCYFVDEAHPEKRIALEVDGCYWHGCPTHAPHKKRLAVTLTKHERNLAHAPGWRIFRFWEHDLLQQPDRCVNLVRHALQSPDFEVEPWEVPSRG